MVRRSDKADDGLAVLKPLYDDMVANGVFTTATQPGGVAFNDEVANFLARFEGYLQSKYDLGADGISLAQAQQIARQEIAKSSVKPADS